MRIAVLGGSFDPIHNGHLQIAKTAMKTLPIDEVWFMPTHFSPLKNGQCVSFADRANMVRLVIRPYRHMRLCTLENEWDKPSYTIRTVKELLRRYPQHSFSWLIGDDQAKKFDQWKDHEELKQLIPFYVFSREDTSYDLCKGLIRVPMDLVAISSSQIRQGSGLSMVPNPVRNYMGKHGLYLEEMVQAFMSEKRFQHSVSVAKLCVRLAHAHGLDTHIAYIMGLVHDVCKELPKTQAEIWMRHHLPAKLEEESAAIWHGYIGADAVRRIFHIYDKRIYEAVYHHVKGRGHTDYDRILFIADKLDPSRGYDSSKEIELSCQDLKKGFAVVKQQQLAYLKKEGVCERS